MLHIDANVFYSLTEIDQKEAQMNTLTETKTKSLTEKKKKKELDQSLFDQRRDSNRLAGTKQKDKPIHNYKSKEKVIL